MAYQAAKGNSPATGMPKQPRPAPPDEVSHMKVSAGGYGTNDAAANPSSAPIGKVISPLAANIRATIDDPALDTILSRPRGALNEDGNDWQTRKISPNADVHPTYGMKPANSGGAPSGTVPGKLGEK